MRACFTLLLAAYAIAFALIVGLPEINAWEKNAGYPYGKMCNSVFTLYQDTCPKH